MYTPWVFLAQEHVHGPAVQVPLDSEGTGSVSPVRRPTTSISGITGIALVASSTAPNVFVCLYILILRVMDLTNATEKIESRKGTWMYMSPEA